jgi:formyltetrahydrofolate deformylase
VLTLSCPDRTGIVAAVSGFLATHRLLITEAQHYQDPLTNRSFMRAVFHGDGGAAVDMAAIDQAFAGEVGERFGMSHQLHEAQRKCRAMILVSKYGHCLNSILHRCSTGTLPIEIAAIASNHPDLRGLAEWHGIPFHHLPIVDGNKRAQELEMEALYASSGAELLVLARYMQILTMEACAHFSGRAINIHHSFLPGFKGAKPYHQAHARGVKIIGATAHYVTTDLDEGPIIEQEVERVDHTLLPEDLTVIGSELEAIVLNRALKWHAERRVFQNGNRTVVLR